MPAPHVDYDREIKDAAIRWVMDLERRAGREPADVRGDRALGDVVSPPRLIEVKAIGKKSSRGDSLWLDARQRDEALLNPNFFIYVVENIRQGHRQDFKLKVYDNDRLRRLLTGAKENHYFEVPVPAGEYKNAGHDDLEPAPDQPLVEIISMTLKVDRDGCRIAQVEWRDTRGEHLETWDSDGFAEWDDSNAADESAAGYYALLDEVAADLSEATGEDFGPDDLLRQAALLRVGDPPAH